MLKDLRASRADGTHERRLARYSSVDLVIIDDLGLRPLAGEEPLDLYEIIRHRYERASTMITSNRALEEWAPLFNDDLLANARGHRRLVPKSTATLEAEGGVLTLLPHRAVDQFRRDVASKRPCRSSSRSPPCRG